MKTNNRLILLMTALSVGVSFTAIAPANAQDTSVVPKSGAMGDSKPSTSERQPPSGASSNDSKGNVDSSTSQAPNQSAPGKQDSKSNGGQNDTSPGSGSAGQTGSQSGTKNKEDKSANGGSNNNSVSPQSRRSNGSNGEQGAGQSDIDTNKADSSRKSGGNVKSSNGAKQDQQTDTTGDETGSKTTTKANTQSSTQLKVSIEQQTQIRQAVKAVHIAPVRETDFSVSVGTAIPRRIELEPLPPRIVQIVPQYKTYRFFVLADGRIVIVDPSTFTIVYIIDA